MRRSVGWVVASLALVVAALAGLFLWATSGWDGDGPGAAERADVVATSGAPVPTARDTLRIVTWNVAFGGGETGTPMDVHDAAEVRGNLQAQAALLRAADPDLVFLQELDRPSARTGDIDEFEVLLEAAGFPYGCYVTTWKVNHVPSPFWPPSRQIGRVHSGQAVLSRFPIEGCVRLPLPQPAENPAWYNRAYLHRCLLEARLRLPDGRGMAVIDVHLEAFSQPNREEQARILAGRVAGIDPGTPLIVAGDFNTVPPGAKQKLGFPDEDTDFRTDRTIAIVRSVAGLREVFLDDAPDVPEESAFTFPTSGLTRRLDYVFARGLGPSIRREVPRTDASDHRPILVEFPFPAAR